jgi:hypothetical protein
VDALGSATWAVPDPDGPSAPPLRVTATLRPGNVVTADGLSAPGNALLGRILTDEYRASPQGPQFGRPGAAWLAELAARHGGTSGMAEVTPDPPGTVY